MKNLLIVFLIIPASLFSQNKLKKAEKETNQCIESFVKRNGVEWKEIQDYFENYLYLTSIRKKDESIEQGYLNLIQLRMKTERIKALPGRAEIKEKLTRAGIIGQNRHHLLGVPLDSCFLSTYKKYKNELPEKSTFVNIVKMFEAINEAEAISSALVAGGLNAAFKENGISHPLYKKVVILTLFIDAIYLDEKFSGEISAENPYIIDLKEVELEKQEELIVLDDEGIEIEEIQIEEVVEVEKVEEDNEEDPIFLIVEKMPEFPGGELGLRNYIAENIQYPEESKKNGIEGRVYVRFCVTKTGKVDNISVIRGVDSLLDKEAIRVIKQLPDWTPGKQRGQKVNVWYTIPVEFFLH